MTQETFAKALGINRVQYSRYELGKRIPPDEVLERIVHSLPDFEVRIYTLITRHLYQLGFPALTAGGPGGKALTKTLDDLCLHSLLVQAQRDTGIVLTVQGYQRVMEIIAHDYWPQIRKTIPDILNKLVSMMSKWKEQAGEEASMPTNLTLPEQTSLPEAKSKASRRPATHKKKAT